jgi:hypothetical protein
MTKISFAAADWGFGASKLVANSRPQVNQDAVSRRLDRLGARRDGARAGVAASPPQHLDARLIEDVEALEAAWQRELRALIFAKRHKTPEAVAAYAAARATCTGLARRIETARALTLDGLKAQARAALWRRDGEPLGPRTPDEPTNECAWTDMADLPQYDRAPAAPQPDSLA